MKTLFLNHLKTYHIYYCFNIGIFIGGLLCGLYYVSYQTDEQLITLTSSLLDLLQGNYIQNQSYVSYHLIESLLIICIIYALSLSVIAVPILPFILFYKSLQFGFTVGLYMNLFNTKAIIGILFTLLPYIIFEFIAYFSSFAVAYEISLSITITSFIKNQTLEFKEVLTHLLNNIIWSLCFIVLSVLTQIYVLPLLFNLFVG